jgi:hypothetical protein
MASGRERGGAAKGERSRFQDRQPRIRLPDYSLNWRDPVPVGKIVMKAAAENTTPVLLANNGR